MLYFSWALEFDVDTFSQFYWCFKWTYFHNRLCRLFWSWGDVLFFVQVVLSSMNFTFCFYLLFIIENWSCFGWGSSFYRIKMWPGSLCFKVRLFISLALIFPMRTDELTTEYFAWVDDFRWLFEYYLHYFLTIILHIWTGYWNIFI